MRDIPSLSTLPPPPPPPPPPSLCNKDPDQKQMDAICNSYLGPEVRAKYKSVKPEKKTNPKKPRNKNKKKTGPNPGKVSKTTFLAEVPRSQTEAGTELCGINNALICRKSTAGSITTPLTTPSPRQIFTQRPETRVTPKARPPQTANSRLKTTTKPKLRKPRPGKAKSKSAKQNQISSRPKGKKGKSRWDLNKFYLQSYFLVFQAVKGVCDRLC